VGALAGNPLLIAQQGDRKVTVRERDFQFFHSSLRGKEDGPI